jgi:RNA polymerase sigma factor (sigma-70 family)
MQDLFIKLSYSNGFARAKNPSAYIRRAGINLAFDWRRNRHSAGTEMPEQPVADDPSVLSALIEAEQAERILEAAGGLTELCRDAFVMRHIEQEPYEDIAKQLGKTPAQVPALCHKAVTRIRELLNADESWHGTLEKRHGQD